jgi:fluoride exporter
MVTLHPVHLHVPSTFQSLPGILASVSLVALGGALGAVVRFGISTAVHARIIRFPLGTLTVNTLGCLLIGILMYFAIDRPTISPQLRLFLMAGFLGGMTTFSSFGYETLGLLRQGNSFMAFANIAGHIVLSLGAVWVGWAGTRMIWG